jgi:hypothetical protein
VIHRNVPKGKNNLRPTRTVYLAILLFSSVNWELINVLAIEVAQCVDGTYHRRDRQYGELSIKRSTKHLEESPQAAR